MTLLWAALYGALDCGVHGTGWYRDVRADPLGLVVSGVLDLPWWLLSLLGPSAARAGAP